MWKNLTAIILTLILALPLMASAGTKVPAKDITVNSTSFSGNLGPLDTSVQHAMETIDQMTGSGVSAVTDVTADYPMASTGGTTPNLSIDLSAYPRSGTLTLNKWCVYNGSSIDCNQDTPGSGSVTSVTASYPLTSSGGTTPNIDIDLSDYIRTADLSAYAPLANPHFTGNVGINSSSPRSELDIDGGVYASENIESGENIIGKTLISSGTGSISQVTLSANNTVMESVSTNGIYFGDLDGAGILKMHIDGNLGIGTSTTRATLEIGTGATIINGSAPVVLVKGNLEIDGKLYGDGSGLTGVSAGSSDHATLTHLAYADSGHTGFQPAGSYLTTVSVSPGLTGSGTVGSPLQVDSSTYIRRGTLTNTKWCTTDGTSVNCTEDTPSGTITAVTGSYPIASSGGATPNITVDLSAYPRKGTLTNGKWCDTDGTSINCTQDQPTGTVASVTASFPLASSGGANPNLTIDLSSYAHTSDLSSYVPTSRQISTTYPLGGGGTLGSNLTLTIDTSAYPRAGTLTTGKWCTSPDGATIACTQDTPSGTLTAVTGTWPIVSSGGTAPNITVDLSAYPQKGTLTNTKWCSSDGTLISCTEDAPAAGSSGANPTGTIGLAAVNGSASTFLRSDGAPALSQAISPTWTGNHTFTPATGNTIINAGNLGIGTITPTSMLEVNGAIYSHQNIGIGTGTPGLALQVGPGASTLSVPYAANSAIIKGNLEVDGFIYGNGSKLIGLTGGGFAGLTANRLVKSTGAFVIADSTVYEVGGNVGMGASLPTYKLDVEGSVYIGSTANRLSIGSTSPVYTLDVNGFANIITTGQNTVLSGGNATMTGSDHLVVIGYRAAESLRTGDYNTVIGSEAGTGTATSGGGNTFIGGKADNFITTGHDNTAVGYYASYLCTTGNYNASVGREAMYANDSGSNNSAFGYNALYTATDDTENTAVGHSAAYKTTASYNTALGALSLYENSSGTYNTAIGYKAGAYKANGTTPCLYPVNSVYIGANSHCLYDADDDAIVIGVGALGQGPHTTIIGTATTTMSAIPAGNVGIGTITPGAALDIGGGSRGHASPTNSILVKGSIEVDTGVYVDGGIYNTNVQGIWFRQPDGGCSLCGPDAAGTAWACVNITCSTAPGL